MIPEGDAGMSTNLAGRRAVVTGAAAGIGRASVLALARAGMKVEAVDRDAAGLETVVAEIVNAAWNRASEDVTEVPARAWAVDLGQAADVAPLIRRVEAEAGPIDLL